MQIGLKKSLLAETQKKCKGLKAKLEQQRLGMGGTSAATKQDVKVLCSEDNKPNMKKPASFVILQHATFRFIMAALGQQCNKPFHVFVDDVKSFLCSMPCLPADHTFQ